MAYNLTFPQTGAALVYGGSGGAGSAICEALAQAGTPVAFTYFSGVRRGEATLLRLKEIGVPCQSYALDGRDTQAVAAMTEQVVETFGGLHTVITASGPRIDFMPIGDMPPDRWRHYLEADATATFNVVHATLPHLRASQGSLTACVTFANRRVLDYDGSSAVPNAAVESLVKQLAAEEGPRGVRANAVGLGWIDVGVGAADTEQSDHPSFGPEGLAQLRAKIRLGRPGTGPELAAAVVFLASQQASYITGQIVSVDGGSST
jgi:3-oxoacyl-[acyl-carrier protein] reductase